MESLTEAAPQFSFNLAAEPATSLLGQAPEELTLRVRGAGRQDETVRVAARKCTIGSDPACTLQLEEFGIRPLHCLILRGESQTIVRSWDSDAQLNGADFFDAVLQPGDRLSLGPIELEVLSLGAASPPASAAPPPSAPPEPDRGEELRQLERELAEREQTWKLRCEQREAEFAKWEQQFLARREELESQRRALDADRAAFSTERQDWETVQDEARTRLNEKIEQANHRLAELAAERQSHERRRSAWAAQRQNLTDELNGQYQALRNDQAALKAEQQALTEARAAQEAEERLRAERLAEREREFARVRSEGEAELAARRAQWDQEKQIWDALRAGWEQDRAELEARQASERQQEDERLAALAAEESALNDQRAALDAERREWSAERSRLEGEAQAREARLAAHAQELEQQIAQRQAALAAEQQRLDERLAAEEAQRLERETRLAERETQLAAREAALAERERADQETARPSDEVESQRQALAQVGEAQERREQEFVARLAAREQEIEQILVVGEQEVSRLHHELAAERHALEAERSAWNDQRQAREQEIEQVLLAGEQDLSRAQAELAAERQAFEERQAAASPAEARATVDPEATAKLEAREREIEQILLASEQELSRLQAELAAERETFESQRQAWEVARREESERGRRELEAQLAARREELEREFQARLAAAADSSSTQALAGDDGYSLAADRGAEMELAQQQLAEQREDLAGQLQSLEEERAAWSAERRRLEAELADERERFERQREEWEASLRAREYRSADATSSRMEEDASQPSPRSTADLLSRFGIGVQNAAIPTASEEDARSTAEPAGRDEAASAPRRDVAARPATEEGEEDSIDDYMARLMERLGSKGAAGQAAPESPRPRSQPARSTRPAEAEAEPPAPTKLKCTSEMTPRAVPAELSSDMSAMRALAIQNAQAALELHARRTVLKRGSSKIVLSTAALAAAGLLMWFHLLGHGLALMFALVCLLVAVAFAGQFVSLRRGARQAPLANSYSQEPPAERDPFTPLRVSDLPAEDAAETATG